MEDEVRTSHHQEIRVSYYTVLSLLRQSLVELFCKEPVLSGHMPIAPT
jgi:hypothetical protein